MRTYSQADWTASLQEWEDGDFSAEWKPYRHQAAMRGMIFPPAGTKWDSWDDAQPSQRAILIRAIRETPKIMSQAISRSGSWFDVIAYVMRRHEDWRAELDARERLIDFDEVPPRQAVMRLGDIIGRIRDSL